MFIPEGREGFPEGIDSNFVIGWGPTRNGISAEQSSPIAIRAGRRNYRLGNRGRPAQNSTETPRRSRDWEERGHRKSSPHRLKASKPTSYDRTPYPSYLHPATHPARLAALSALHGVDAPDAGRCRVLELGCGDGTNLLSMATTLPGASFVGVDLAASAVNAGKATARAVGLTNITFHHASVTDIDRTWGRFDYIVAHGLYSWVPPVVRESILSVCAQNLAEDGIAYVSYLTHPGGYLVRALREMMFQNVDRSAEPKVQFDQAQGFLSQLGDALDGTGNPTQQWLRREVARARDYSASYLLHDDLSEVQDACWFADFAQLAAVHDLQYLTDSLDGRFLAGELSGKTRAALAQMDRDRLRQEQFIDHVIGRRFRATLLCHRTRSVGAERQATGLDNLLVSASLAPMGGTGNLTDGVPVRFGHSPDAHMEVEHAIAKAALVELSLAWPGSIRVDRLRKQAKQRLASGGIVLSRPVDAQSDLAGTLLRGRDALLIDLTSCPMPLATQLSSRPVASPLARHQAASRAPSLALLRHQHCEVGMDDPLRTMLPLLDGTREISALKHELALGSSPLSAEVVEQNLQRALRLGLLTVSQPSNTKTPAPANPRPRKAKSGRTRGRL